MNHPRIALPDAGLGLLVVASVSGGKDSTALMLACREAEIPFLPVFADTGWEAPESYEYLATLERVLGITFARVGFAGGMRAKIRQRAGFPARMQRWCTRELKLDAIREYHDRVAEEHDTDTVSAVGIRADESPSRALAAEWEYSPEWGGYVWRPLLKWTIADVLAIHHRHGVPIHPLYKRGHSRVGCWPCIFADKEEIRLWAEHDPASVAEVRALELECEQLRAERNAETPGRYKHQVASFFQSREATKDATGKRVYLAVHVDRVVEWANTDRGGKQLALIREEPDGGCFRWGLCEPPTRGSEE